MNIMNGALRAGALFIVLSAGTAAFQANAAVDGIIAAKAADLKPLKYSEVCMVTNNYMGKEQIPVKIDGKTYYGCCKDCAGKLKKNHNVRFSKDPVTGKEVDKATAFIIADAAGKAMYFESGETAGKYLASKNRDVRK